MIQPTQTLPVCFSGSGRAERGWGIYSAVSGGSSPLAACLRPTSSTQRRPSPAVVEGLLEHLHHNSGHCTRSGLPQPRMGNASSAVEPSCDHHSTPCPRWAPGTEAATLPNQAHRRPSSAPTRSSATQGVSAPHPPHRPSGASAATV